MGTAEANGKLWGHRAREWAELQEGTARPTYEAVLTRTSVGAGTRFLDVGCGSGMALSMAASRGAKVAGIDAAEALLAIARERTPHAELHHGEIEKLPFEDASFDVVTGFNSFQYAANPVGALSEAKRVAKRGATVVIVTWGKPEGMEAAAVISALKPLMPPPPPGVTPPGPFALSDEAALRKLAMDAGLDAGEIFDVEMIWEYPDLRTAIRGLNSSGVAARAIAHSGEDAVTKAHEDALARFKSGDGCYRFGARFRGLLARA